MSGKKDILAETGSSVPFEERVEKFERLVQAIGIGVGGSEEYLIRQYGRLIVEYHELDTDDARDKFKEEKMDPMMDKIGEAEKINSKVGSAVAKIVFAEGMLS